MSDALAAIAGAPALALLPSNADAVSPVDAAVIAKAAEVRRLMHEAEAAWRRCTALDAMLWRTSRHDLGRRPEIDGERIADLALEVLAELGEAPESDVAEAVAAKRRILEERVAGEAAAWAASHQAIADRLGIKEAEAREAATTKAEADAMTQLGAMPVDSLAGIAAEASVFRAPFAFGFENYDHLDLAHAILRDFGCEIETEDADV